MALTATIYNFDVDLADADRQVSRELYVSIGSETLVGAVVRLNGAS